MKKAFLLFSVVLLSCSPDEPQQQEPPVDCNCDRVVEVNTFNIIGTPQNPAITYHSVYITINDCTQIQRQKTFDTTNSQLVPQVGQCR